ncbi:MAG: helix-turn-helix transcriptional regulator [Acidobacteria bacterium]|nr:helix-turn-helix transcriptional regulator [Acidobacteriota bacterium]
MGRKARPKPEFLSEKLLRIRIALGLSQDGIIETMGLTESITRNRISEYELGFEPPLPTLLHYAHLANVYVDVLIDDELDLPAKLPSSERSAGVKRKKRPTPN